MCKRGTHVTQPRTNRRWMLCVLSLLLVAALGILARLLLATHSLGSNDSVLWQVFAVYLADHGLCATYRELPAFNHPPLIAYLSVAALWFDRLLPVSFATLFKLPGIAGEALVVYLIWRTLQARGALRAASVAAAYSLNPASLLVSGYHGNTDCLCVAFVLLAAVLVHEKRHPVLVGLALGAAINVKLIPIVLVPVLGAFYYPAWRDLTRYLAGLAVAALPFALMLPVYDAYYRNAIAYNSIYGLWGFGELYFRTPVTLPQVHQVIGKALLPAGRYAIMLGAVAIGIWQAYRPRFSAFEATALCMSAFLILAPGFGMQYIVYPLPMMFLVRLSWGLRYSWLAGTFAALVYYTFWTRTWPPYSDFNTLFHMPSELLGLLAWVTLIGFAAYLVRKHPAAATVRQRSTACGRRDGGGFALSLRHQDRGRTVADHVGGGAKHVEHAIDSEHQGDPLGGHPDGGQHHGESDHARTRHARRAH